MLTINSRREVYINKSFFCRTHSKATMSQWCDSSDVVLPTLLWRRRNITEVNDSPTFPMGGANLERCDVMWKLQWISCFICYWLSVKNVSLNGCTKTPDLNMLLQCNANNFLHTLRHTHNMVTSGHRCPSWIVPDNLYFICRGVTGSISPEVSLVKLSHLKGLTRRMNLLMFAKPHTSSSSSVSILVIFFCAMTSISGYKLWHNKKGPAVVLLDMFQRKEQNLTLCTRFASAQSFHAVSVSQGRRRVSCELNAARL